jgi:integrase
MDFGQLADQFEKDYLKEPKYIDGRKVAGLRSYYGLRIRLKMLKATRLGFVVRVAYTDGRGKRREAKRVTRNKQQAEALAKQMLASLGASNGVSIADWAIEEKSGGQRSLTTVNRELGLIRRIFNIALSNGWIKQNPFEKGDALIRPGDEKRRQRIITREEETRLLAACSGRRAHLRPLVVCALDTGMRKGEILKLVPSDLDFENRVITVRALNTKTMRERQVAMTDRLAKELLDIIDNLPAEEGLALFGIRCDFKKAYDSARNAAGLGDVRFHDLRHTHATRLVASHIPLSEVGLALGHTQANTTFRYVNANIESARRVAAALAEFNSSVEDGEKPAVN